MKRTILTACAGWAVAVAAFSAEPQWGLRPWLEYRTILWISDHAYQHPDRVGAFFQCLRDMGINTAMVYGASDPSAVVTNGFPYYVENIVNRGLCLKFNSPVADWDPFVTHWAKSGRSTEAFIRPQSLDDPAWQAWAAREVRDVVRANREHQPLAYDLRDELSTTLSANPFDFDFGPAALASFRLWLQSAYGSLDRLNSAWETQFQSWAEIRPFSTDQIKERMVTGQAHPPGRPNWPDLAAIQFDPLQARAHPARWNLSPWCDFRTYMDASLARALDELRQVAHVLDPATPVGIEGTQMPHAFGGYDLGRLAQAVDWVEPYDVGNARSIFGSFMRGKPILTTVFEKDTNLARRRLWHLLLEGDRGCIIWWSEDCLAWNGKTWELTPKARALTPVLRELTSPLASLFMKAVRESDPIALVYSQPSIQVDWLIESTRDGATWPRRFSSFEADHNRHARIRNSWLKGLEDLGYSPMFITAPDLASGALARERIRALILPDTIALSAAEAEQVRLWAGAGDSETRAVLSQGTPGLFNEHGRLLPNSPFEDWFPLSPGRTSSCARIGTNLVAVSKLDAADYSAARLRPDGDSAWWRWLREQMERIAPRPAQITVEGTATARVRLHRFRLGTARLIALERNIHYQMSEELKQAGGNEALEQPVTVTVRFPQTFHIYDLRERTSFGKTAVVQVRLDPWNPSLLALLPDPVVPADLTDLLQKAVQ